MIKENMRGNKTENTKSLGLESFFIYKKEKKKTVKINFAISKCFCCISNKRQKQNRTKIESDFNSSGVRRLENIKFVLAIAIHRPDNC